MIYRLLQILLLSIALTEAKKKKRVKKAKTSTRPTDLVAKDYCSACAFVVEVALGKLRSSRKEYDVIEAMDGICKISDEIARNPYLPPDVMIRACEAFVGNWND